MNIVVVVFTSIATGITAAIAAYLLGYGGLGMLLAYWIGGQIGLAGFYATIYAIRSRD